MPSKEQRLAQERKGQRLRALMALAGVGALLLVAVLIGFAGFQRDTPETGQTAPAYNFTDTFGNSYSLEDLRGKPVIITTMAAWCVSCVQEHRDLQQVHEAYNNGTYPNPKVAIVSLDIDPQDTPQALREFQSRYGGDWSFALDRDGATRKFDITRLDTTIILDAEGRIVYRDERPTTASEFFDVLRSLQA